MPITQDATPSESAGSERDVITRELAAQRKALVFACTRLPQDTWTTSLGDPRGTNTPLNLVADVILWEALFMQKCFLGQPLVLDPDPHQLDSMPELMALYKVRAEQTAALVAGHALGEPTAERVPPDVAAANLRALLISLIAATAATTKVLQFVWMKRVPWPATE